jgi:hypothetical protein
MALLVLSPTNSAAVAIGETSATLLRLGDISANHIMRHIHSATVSSHPAVVLREISKSAFTCAAFSPDGSLFCISEDTKNIFIYNAANWEVIKTLYV